MSTHVIEINKAEIQLGPPPDSQVRIELSLPCNYERPDPRRREDLEKELRKHDFGTQINIILKERKGPLGPMRSYGAGALALVRWPGEKEYFAVLNIRGTNRGEPWPLGRKLADALCWKECGGVTGSPAELLDPESTARKELYEEVAFVSVDEVMLPERITEYPDTLEQVRVGIARARRHYGFNLVGLMGSYTEVGWDGHANTTVQIESPKEKPKEIHPIVNYDPVTTALEFSWVARIELKKPVTGILSLAGPENSDAEVRPYMEDIVLVREEILRGAVPGQSVPVKHLLSVHGPSNMSSRDTTLTYNPAPTLVPLVSALKRSDENEHFAFEKVLIRAKEKITSAKGGIEDI